MLTAKKQWEITHVTYLLGLQWYKLSENVKARGYKVKWRRRQNGKPDDAHMIKHWYNETRMQWTGLGKTANGYAHLLKSLNVHYKMQNFTYFTSLQKPLRNSKYKPLSMGVTDWLVVLQ